MIPSGREPFSRKLYETFIKPEESKENTSIFYKNVDRLFMNRTGNSISLYGTPTGGEYDTNTDSYIDMFYYAIWPEIDKEYNKKKGITRYYTLYDEAKIFQVLQEVGNGLVKL
jgi:hypothetical protein